MPADIDRSSVVKGTRRLHFGLHPRGHRQCFSAAPESERLAGELAQTRTKLQGLTMHVRDVMTREVLFATPRQNLEDVARRMITEDIGFMPVIEDGRLVGVVTDRDMAVRGFTDNMSGANLVRDVMSIDAAHCLDEDDVRAAIEMMAELKIRRLPVLDRDERLVGVIALADLISSEPAAVAAIKAIMTPGPPNSQIADLDPVGTAGHRF